MYHYSVVILLLLNLYCYASPIRSGQQPSTINEESEMMEPIILNINPELPSIKALYQFEYLKMLCEVYGRCEDNDDEDDTKYKRLSSSLFQGFPKFGKRTFSSAFSGIPKFG